MRCPVPNRRAIEETIKLGLALDCTIAERAVFHRKNYFYPDLPKAYQISQYDEPLCSNGRLAVPTADGDVVIGITRAHLEEDAAKNVHVAASGRLHGATATLVDFNRGGTPLVEIVTEPDLHDAETAKRFLQLLRQTVVELDLSDAELEKGSMRFDVNVSVRPAGTDELRTRTELKNMNSFNFAAKGIEREIARQIQIYEAGGEVQQETLHFVPGDEESPPSRSKEEAQDYRYFPEPDLVPVQPPGELVERLRGEIGELPGARIRRIADTLVVLRRRRARHGWARPALVVARRCRRRSEGSRERPGQPVRRHGHLGRRGERRGARRGSSRPGPRFHAPPSTRRSRTSGTPTSLLRLTSSRSSWRTRVSSTRSSTGSSRRIPARLSSFVAARRACSASSSVR